ncbi:unnamed protein product [Nesidiocoris tenuis]|uniref:Uncharacterized protein n=1 Tax=Nesidiocoris tenuis TaxID=355587 RepID=A0A6H5GEC5_9HEMI|nr:unnamed protein product [Nesidiocoris tenuis]
MILLDMMMAFCTNRMGLNTPITLSRLRFQGNSKFHGKSSSSGNLSSLGNSISRSNSVTTPTPFSTTNFSFQGNFSVCIVKILLMRNVSVGGSSAHGRTHQNSRNWPIV